MPELIEIKTQSVMANWDLEGRFSPLTDTKETCLRSLPVGLLETLIRELSFPAFSENLTVGFRRLSGWSRPTALTLRTPPSFVPNVFIEVFDALAYASWAGDDHEPLVCAIPFFVNIFNADARHPSYRHSPSSSGFSSLGPSHLRPSPHARNGSQLMSWIAPEDYDPTNPTTMFDAPIPRPMGHIPRTRSVSFGAASSLLGVGEGSTRAPSPFGLNPREGSLRAASVLGMNAENRASTSLSLNYVPTKFSDALVVGGARRRRVGKEAALPAMARGGGVDAFRKGEARVADDRDDLHPPAHRRGLYTVFALVGLVGMILIWLDILNKSDVIRVANRTELVFSTLAAAVAVFTCVFGWAGVMLNNRSFLAFYCFFLWFSFAFLVTPGYLTYRRHHLNLEGKVNFEWSETFDIDARRRIQNALGCCGYFNPYVEASISATCYARSVLPGCKGPFFSFEHHLLKTWYITVFSLVAFHITLIAASLLCSNHVTYRFGKGMMPKAYRLNAEAVAAIMDNYATQLAEDYGPDVAAAFVTHSRAASTVDLTDMPMDSMGFSSAREAPPAPGAQTRYGTIPGTTPDTAI
ncbi:Tetraspanin Tsp2 [Mycena venus]|uniref:Tetraspanin Tsp2 n=1 Tax=Mycena venus TaxID=2733690 RepID=A0A8H7D2B5_9AGAR|nr:Tetraspanin Tsp2 [Mycena venus]